MLLNVFFSTVEYLVVEAVAAALRVNTSKFCVLAWAENEDPVNASAHLSLPSQKKVRAPLETSRLKVGTISAALPSLRLNTYLPYSEIRFCSL